jgi:hypothetical protein
MDVNGLIAIIFFFTSLMVIGGSAIIGRHRERMGMIEKGMKAEDIKAMFGRSFEEPHPLTSLKWGIVLVSVGLAVMLGLFLHSAYNNIEGGIFPGLVAVFGGAGLILFYFIANRKVQD